MTSVELRNEYSKLKALEDSDDGIFEFKKILLSQDSDDFLDFHIDILRDREDQYLHRDIRSFFSKRKNPEKVALYISNKINEGLDDKLLLADLIQVLGSLKSPFAKEIAYSKIQSDFHDIRYRCIIVLGWTGSTADDIDKLNERMINDEDGQLRGYAATAMRQIWYNKKSLKNRISKHIAAAIASEKDEEALIGMIITLQDIHRKKLGLKESKYGDVSGDVDTAKFKAIKMLEKL